MPLSLISNERTRAQAPEADPARQAWSILVDTYREACLLHHEGREDEARRMAAEDLPPAVRTWSRHCTDPAADKKQRLAEMFKKESERIADAALVQRLVIRRLTTEVLPNLTALVRKAGQQLPEPPGEGPEPARSYFAARRAFQGEASPVVQKAALRNLSQSNPYTTTGPRKVPIDDISGMIDALHAEEFRPLAKALAPLRALAG